MEDRIQRLRQPGGKTLSWSADSGVKLIEKDGFFFKDLERTGELLPFEDWRLSPEERARDLASRLSREEIAGLMLYSPHQQVPPPRGSCWPGTWGGKALEDTDLPPYTLSDQQIEYLEDRHVRHILVVQVESPATAAKWNNELQAFAEARPHGIPVNISTDPRNGSRPTSEEYRTEGSDISRWPEGMGFAACFDPEVVRQFAHDASIEYRALGISTALGPQIDLCTEPRWLRWCDTLGMVPEDVIPLVKAYCDGMQTTEGEPDGWGMQSVNTMVKHWPGGGSGEGGRDAHYPFGKYAVYPGNNAAAHMRPFTEGGFKLDGPTGSASAVMPYYTVSWGLDTKYGKNVGNSFSKYIIHDLLREKYGFDGIVCTDWNITAEPEPGIDSFGSRCHNVQDMTVAERHLTAILNGVDQFGGNDDPAPILEAWELGEKEIGAEAMDARMRRSAERLLINIFHCGLFEDPYLDPEQSERVVGCEEFRRHGEEAQRRSVVLLKNRDACLPLKPGIRVYIPTRHLKASKAFARDDLPERDVNPVPDSVISKYAVRVAAPEEADAAIVFAESPASNPYKAEDVEAGGNGYFPIQLQYRPYTAEEARDPSIAGGDFREKSANRSYRGKSNTAYNEADLDNILECRARMGDKPVIVVETLNNPMVMSEFEPQADGILAEFGVSREAALDIIFGRYTPMGRLPAQLPADMACVERHCEDVPLDLEPYTDEAGNSYDYGFGLTY